MGYPSPRLDKRCVGGLLGHSENKQHMRQFGVHLPAGVESVDVVLGPVGEVGIPRQPLGLPIPSHRHSHAGAGRRWLMNNLVD